MKNNHNQSNCIFNNQTTLIKKKGFLKDHYNHVNNAIKEFDKI
jgi:hypothetical protein